jgi:hypothetical protein
MEPIEQNICKTLLTGFFDPSRPRITAVRRLWLENCDIQFDLSTSLLMGLSSGPNSLLTPSLDATELKSIRIRRLRLDATTHPVGSSGFLFALARAGTTVQMQDGRGSMYDTTVAEPTQAGFNNPGLLPDQIEPARREFEQSTVATFYDRNTYSTLQEVKSFLNGKGLGWDVNPCGPRPPAVPPNRYRQSTNITAMLDQSRYTLTSLNLDWLMLAPGQKASRDSLVQYDFFQTLSGLRFQNLRAFQLRNTVCASTRVPDNVYLLQPTKVEAGTGEPNSNKTCKIDFLSFLENHTKLECLAWPLERFFAKRHVYSEAFERAEAVALRLGITLKTLRLDSYFDSWGEDQTDERANMSSDDKDVRTRRRLFISFFAPNMRSLRTLKLEVSFEVAIEYTMGC